MKQPKTYLTYIKFPEYIIPYLKKRYGNPMTFDRTDKFYKLIFDSLAVIEDMNRKFSRISCSHTAYVIAQAKRNGIISEDELVGTPSGDDVDMFVAVKMPQTVLVRNEDNIKVSTPTGPYHVLPILVAQKVRQLARKMFWTDLYYFHQEYSSGGTRKDSTFRFMRMHNIPIEMFENIDRTQNRLKAEIF